MAFYNILISLHIILPVLGALLSIVFRRHVLIAKAITLGSLAALVIASIYILLSALAVSEFSYSFGGWPVPFGIEFKINYYNALFLVLISFAALCSFLYGQLLLQIEMGAARVPVFYALFLICLFGMYGLVMTNDFFNLYVFVEINSIATYTLVSWNSSNRRALLAAFYYLIVGSVAATFILIGIGYLYSASGTLNMGDFMAKFQSIRHLSTISVGICFIALGLFIKSALFPLHSWLLKVYSETNSFILSFFGATSHKIYLFVFVKLFYLGLFDLQAIKLCLLPAGILTITIFSIRAIYSKNLRNILALSGLIQVGYVLILLAFEYKFSFQLIVLQLASYGLTAMTLFMIAIRFANIRGSYNLDNLGKITKQAPLYVCLFTINAFSLIGFPLTAGFLPKFGLFIDLIHNRSWTILAFTSCASFCAMIYLFRVINIFIFGQESSSASSSLATSNAIGTIVVVVLTIVNLALGFASLSWLRDFIM